MNAQEVGSKKIKINVRRIHVMLIGTDNQISSFSSRFRNRTIWRDFAGKTSALDLVEPYR